MRHRKSLPRIGLRMAKTARTVALWQKDYSDRPSFSTAMPSRGHSRAVPQEDGQIP